jgi:hypothetical protein
MYVPVPDHDWRTLSLQLNLSEQAGDLHRVHYAALQYYGTHYHLHFL